MPRRRVKLAVSPRAGTKLGDTDRDDRLPRREHQAARLSLSLALQYVTDKFYTLSVSAFVTPCSTVGGAFAEASSATGPGTREPRAC